MKDELFPLIKVIKIRIKLKWFPCTFHYVICLALDITITPTIVAYMSIGFCFLFSNHSMCYMFGDNDVGRI